MSFFESTSIEQTEQAGPLSVSFFSLHRGQYIHYWRSSLAANATPMYQWVVWQGLCVSFRSPRDLHSLPQKCSSGVWPVSGQRQNFGYLDDELTWKFLFSEYKVLKDDLKIRSFMAFRERQEVNLTPTMAATFIHEIGLQPNKGHISSWAVAHHLSVGEPAIYSGWGQWWLWVINTCKHRSRQCLGCLLTVGDSAKRV